jgi:hypothetical protein
VLFAFVKNVVQIAFLLQWPLINANISVKIFSGALFILKVPSKPGPHQLFDASYAPDKDKTLDFLDAGDSLYSIE